MSFKIEEWQVMQAWKNGASIESTSRIHPKWVLTTEPEWNWQDNDYRIANLTADGMRLDELVSKYPERVVLKNKIISVGIYSIGERDIDCSTIYVVNAMACHPEAISQIKTNIELKEKKLRQFNEKELRELVGKCITTDSISNPAVLVVTGFDGCDSVRLEDKWVTSTDLLKYKWMYNGSPCGVLE